MSKIEELRAQRRELDQQRDILEKQARELQWQIKDLDEQIDRLTYACPCVRLNKDLDIYNMGEQERAGRNGLGLGLVCETLSAKKNCSICHGSGKPPWAAEEAFITQSGDGEDIVLTREEFQQRAERFAVSVGYVSFAEALKDLDNLHGTIAEVELKVYRELLKQGDRK